RDHEHDRTFRVGFDQLVLGMGARPIRPPLPGIDGPGIFGVATLADGVRLAAQSPSRVVVVGAGYIGLEMAEAFLRRGASVTVVERGAEVMRTLDPDMGALVSRAMRRHGVDVRCDTATLGFEPGVVHTSG